MPRLPPFGVDGVKVTIAPSHMMRTWPPPVIVHSYPRFFSSDR
jgi:hypothetical protein